MTGRWDNDSMRDLTGKLHTRGEKDAKRVHLQ